MKKRNVLITIIILICVCFTYLVVRDMKMIPKEGRYEFSLLELIDEKEKTYILDDSEEEYVKLTIEQESTDEYTICVIKANDIHTASLKVIFTVDDVVTITSAKSHSILYDISNKKSIDLKESRCEIITEKEIGEIGALCEMVWVNNYKGLISMSYSGYLDVILTKNGVSEISWHI